VALSAIPATAGTWRVKLDKPTEVYRLEKDKKHTHLSHVYLMRSLRSPLVRYNNKKPSFQGRLGAYTLYCWYGSSTGSNDYIVELLTDSESHLDKVSGRLTTFY
jgi:hypothetical protein